MGKTVTVLGLFLAYSTGSFAASNFGWDIIGRCQNDSHGEVRYVIPSGDDVWSDPKAYLTKVKNSLNQDCSSDGGLNERSVGIVYHNPKTADILPGSRPDGVPDPIDGWWDRANAPYQHMLIARELDYRC